MEVNGYSFRWLRNRAAFAGAGAAMRNCLGEYRPGENRVAVAWRGDEPAAAVEVSPRGTILQAYGPDNIPLRSESRVSRALSAWAARCRFRMRESTLFDEMDDLPF